MGRHDGAVNSAAPSADLVAVPGHDGVALRATTDRHVAPAGSGRLCRRGSIARRDPVALRVAADRHIAHARRTFRGLRVALRAQSRLDTPALEFEANLLPI